MKVNQAKTNWIIDAILFTGFIILFFLDLTRVALHQWIGVTGGALALYHLLAHWEWVEAVSKRMFGHTTWKARLYYLVDAALLLGFVGILISGLVISTWLSLPLGNMPSLIDFHVTTSVVTLILVIFKLAIHWRWIVKTARRMFPQRSDPTPPRPVTQPVRAAVGSDRRDFLKMMGIVGAAAALALINVAGSSAESETQVTSAQSLSNTSGSTETGATQSSSTSTCIGRCSKGRSCTYPGHCRQYRDTNGNGRCDLGECS